MPTWEEALFWANGPGTPVIDGLIISVLIEYWPAFQAMKQKNKVLVYIGLCLLVPLVATVLGIATHVYGDWGDVRTTWWFAIRSGLTAASLGTLFHAWAPSPLRLKRRT